MSVIYYSGGHSINTPGATRATDIPIVEHMVAAGERVLWAGRGLITETPFVHNLEEAGLHRLILRIWGKLRRSLFSVDPKRLVLNEYERYDKALAKRIRSGKIPVDGKTALVGRSGMTKLSFEAVRECGGKTILHAQWMHPIKQQRILTETFEHLGIVTGPILQERVDRQLEEIRIVDFVWCISRLVEESFVANGVPRDKLFTVPYGVDFAKYNACEKADMRDETFTIVFVGNVNPEKGAHLLLQAVYESDCRNIDLIFNGVLHDYFRTIFDSWVVKLKEREVRVHLLPGDPLPNYARASLFVLPSLHESFGLVTLEAMAAGLPVIVSDHVGAQDCVAENINGLIFENGNVQALKDAINTLYRDSERAKEWGRKSSSMAEGADWPVSVRRLLEEIRARV